MLKLSKSCSLFASENLIKLEKASTISVVTFVPLLLSSNDLVRLELENYSLFRERLCSLYSLSSLNSIRLSLDMLTPGKLIEKELRILDKSAGSQLFS